MRDEDRFALMLARLIDLLHGSPDASDDHRVALESVGEMTSRRSWSLQRKGTQLSVEGKPVPPEVPLVPGLVARMRIHGVTELHFGFGVAELDIMLLMQALTGDPKEPENPTEVKTQLERGQVQRIWIMGAAEASRARSSRQMRISEALKASGVIAADAVEIPPLETIATSDTAAQRLESREALPEPVERSVEVEPAKPTAVAGNSLAAKMQSLAQLESVDELNRGLNELTDKVVAAAREGRKEEVAELLVVALRQEGESKNEDTRRAYGVALRRMMGPETLRPLADLLLDPLYARDVMAILERTGTVGTQLLLDLLVGASTFAERRAFLGALREMGAGTDRVIAMLGHHQWYVVRNVADLVGDLKMEEAVPALGEAVGHSDARVRCSVGIALARIGTRVTARHLRSLLRDPDPHVRLTVVREVGGAGLGALVGTLINQADEEEDDRLRCEQYRALGRIGTPEAVKALTKAAQTRGRFGQRNTVLRKAATEGLALAGSPDATKTLRDLARDRDKEVRECAEQGLKELASGGLE